MSKGIKKYSNDVSLNNFNLDNILTMQLVGSYSGYTIFQASSSGNTILYTLPSTVGSSGYVLSTDGTGILNWISVSGSSFSSASLSGLTDVTLSGLSSGDMLIYTGTTNKWKNVSTIDSTTLFYTQSQSNNNFLSANTILYSSLSALTDVAVSGLTTGQILIFTGTTNKWVNQNTIDLYTKFYTIDQVNLLISGLTNNVALNTYFYNSAQTNTYFYNSAQTNTNFLSATTNLIQLRDVFVTGLSFNQILVTSGSNVDHWVNVPIIDLSTIYYSMTQINQNFLSAISFVDINRQGFVDNTQTQLVFDITTSALTLSAITDWSYYRLGKKFTIQGNKSIIITTYPSTNYISINSIDGTLSQSSTYWDLSQSKLPVAIVKIDKSQTPQFLIEDERHTCLIDTKIHEYLHETRGTALESGGIPSGLVVGSDTDVSKRPTISTFVIYDEDLQFTGSITPSANTSSADYFTIFRTSGSTLTNWKFSNMPFVYNTGTNLMQWDNNTVLTDVTGGSAGSARWYNSYMLLTNLSGNNDIVFIPGRGQFTSLASAQAEDPTSFDFTGFDVAEAYISYQFTWSKDQSAITSQGGVLYAASKRIGATISNVSVPISTVALSNLTDVSLTSPSYGQVLTFNGSLWVNSAITNNTNFLSANTYLGFVTTGSTQTITGLKSFASGLTINSYTPPSSTGGTGTIGQLSWDSSYLYVCISTNTWRRVPLNVF